MADNDLPSYLPPPTQFLQEEASEDDYGEEEEDEEFEQPLLQIKMNGRAARSNAQQGFSIPSSSFYGRSDEDMPVHDGTVYQYVEDDSDEQYEVQQSQMSTYFVHSDQSPHQLIRQQLVHQQACEQRRQQQFAASHHDYVVGSSSASYTGGHRMYTVSSGSLTDVPSVFDEKAASSSNSVDYLDDLEEPSMTQMVHLQQPQLYQQQILQEPPRVVSNESNRYTVVGHTSEGQPIYALQSISHTERPKAQPSQQIYRVADASGQPRYAYALATPTRTVQQQPVRTIAREYYVHSNEVLNEMQATPVLTNVDLTATRGQPEAQASPSSQVTVLQPSLVTSRLKKKAAASEEDQRRSDQMSGSAVAAQAGAIQRFGTLAGWKQMGAWLKNAEKNGDWNRLKLLLSQCAQANLTVELLQANDTPKFVRKLSKTCIDVDVRKVCGDLVLRWKRLIASPPVAAQSEEPKRVGSAKRKTPHPSSADASARIAKKSKEAQEVRKVRVETRKRSEEQKVDNTTTGLQDSAGVETQKETNKVDESPESSQKAESSKSMIDSQKPIGDSSTSAAESTLAVKAEGSAKKSQSVSDKTDKSQPTPKGSSKISEFNMFEKLRQERKEEKRPKRSRTYMAKFRSTGAVEFMRSLRVIVRSVLLYIMPFYI